ncbi:MAG: ABC transporter substrate-binding protein [Candidatus Poribacteria bacterium]|nr:ABC transporter substrate-binding protein [Candidatus Poribacteria bacterium]
MENKMNRIRRTFVAFILTIVALSLGLLGCERIASVIPDTQTPQMPDSEILIGVHVPLTGTWAEPYGLPMQRGFELAREEINAANLLAADLSFITIDDQSTVEGSKQAMQELVSQGVPAIVGIGISTHLIEAVSIAQDKGVIAFSSLSSAAGLSELGDFVFRAPLAVDIYIPSGILATQEKLGYQTAALIYDASDVYSTSSNDEVHKALLAQDVEILTIQTFATGDTDFSEQLAVIMEMEPDVLFISGLAEEIIEIIIDGRAMGIPDSVDFIVPELGQDEVQKAGSAAEGVITFLSWSHLSDTPGNSTFVANYRAAYGIEPEPWAAQSHATLYILANAIATAGLTDAAAIRDALAATKDFPTVLGNFSFDPNGEAMYDPVVLIVTNGELRLFE